MNRDRLLLVGLVAPVPISLTSATVDRVMSTALVLVLVVVGIGHLVQHLIAERALTRECTRPREVVEPVEVLR